jgi:colicin import membrane protein
MKQLIPIETVNAIELFTNEVTIQAMLDEIKAQATDFKPDTSTPDGRKEIASQAHKVSRSKVVIDNAGKELTSEWARKKKVVDHGRKLARDFCDTLRDDIRQPLTDYETKEAKLAEAAAEKAKMEAAELEAYAENDLFDREAKVRETEARIEAERVERERIETEEREAKEREAHDEQVRKDAEERATREAAEAIERETKRAEKADQDRIDAEQRALDAADRAAEAADAAQKAAVERAERIAKEEADTKERDRLRLIADNEREAQCRATDKENRRKINNLIVNALVAGGVSKTAAVKTVTLIASGKVPAVSIRY